MKQLFRKCLSALLVAVLMLFPLALAEETEPQAVEEAAEEEIAVQVVEPEDELQAEETVEPVEEVPEETAEPVEEVPEESAELELVEPSESEVELVEDDGAEMSYEPEKYMTSNEIAIDAAHFPDSAFRSYISQSFDLDGNGSLSAHEIDNATQMDLGRRNGASGDMYTWDDLNYNIKANASSLQGIEYLSNLTYLYCEGLKLTSLDLSGNTKLQIVDCIGCHLTSLTLGSNAVLCRLSCQGNDLSALDISGCPKLNSVVSASNFRCGFMDGISWNEYTDVPSYYSNMTADSCYLEYDIGTALVGASSSISFVRFKQTGTIYTTSVGNNFVFYAPRTNYALPNNDAQSSNTAVVSHNSNGLWTANGEGTAVITTNWFGDLCFIATVKVGPAGTADNVSYPSTATLPVTKSAKYKVEAGTKFQIYLNGQTGKGFKSSNKKVATVSSKGVVSAKSAGKAKITFKSGKQNITLTLTVVDYTIPTKVSLNLSGTVAAKVGSKVTLTASMDSGAVSKLKWTTSNKKIATVKNGVVTFKKKGTVTITVTTVKGNKKAKVKFKVTK